MVNRLLTFATKTIHSLPIIILMPHSRCNCRCIMCDIWKANQNKEEMSKDELRRHIDTFVALGVKHVVMSGGEALMHSNLWELCSMLKKKKIRITILSSGLTLERHLDELTLYCDEVIVSLDGSKSIHNKIRNIPNAFEKLSAGIIALKDRDSTYKIKGRCVIQRHNYKDFSNIVLAANEIRLDQISFLAADVSTRAFNRDEPWDNETVNSVALTMQEAEELREILLHSFDEFKPFYDSGFIAERPQKLLGIAQYYYAINGEGNFPKTVCNAPLISAVMESNGDVLPCFFHKPYGNVNGSTFLEVINSKKAIEFRRTLDVDKDEICKSCVCSLHVGLTKRVLS